MDESVISGIAPGAERFGRSQAPEHELTVSAHGRLELSPQPKASAWGVLWLLPAEHLGALDTYYRVGTGESSRTTIRIITPAGPPAQAIWYQPVPETTPASILPINWLSVFKAAKHNDLPTYHQAVLKKLAEGAAQISR